MSEPRETAGLASTASVLSDNESASSTLVKTASPKIQPSNNSGLVSQAQHDALQPPDGELNTDSKLENKTAPNVNDKSNLDTLTPHSETMATAGNVQDCIVHAPDLLQGLDGPEDKRLSASLNKATGMSDRIGIHYQVIPPGFRTASPHAHSAEDELVFCLQGRGLLWQNGWTYPFVPGDVAGWKAGTGVTHAIINDTKHVPGDANSEEEEDLILIVVGENKPGQDRLYYPYNPEKYDTPGTLRWDDHKPQNQGGQHPGLARAERPNDALPDSQIGPRPSNILNWQEQLAPTGGGELFAYATSLSQETGLSGRFGCNLEIAPPGARSSDPHAHSVEDELVFIIKGEGKVWLDGDVFPVSAGDAIGFRGGTGLAHTIINDSNASNPASGEDLVMWIVGENRRSEDRVVYPLHPEKSQTFKRWWKDAPQRKLGGHNGRPSNPRV